MWSSSFTHLIVFFADHLTLGEPKVSGRASFGSRNQSLAAAEVMTLPFVRARLSPFRWR
jgi:hypothetical protein